MAMPDAACACAHERFARVFRASSVVSAERAGVTARRSLYFTRAPGCWQAAGTAACVARAQRARAPPPPGRAHICMAWLGWPSAAAALRARARSEADSRLPCAAAGCSVCFGSALILVGRTIGLLVVLIGLPLLWFLCGRSAGELGRSATRAGGGSRFEACGGAALSGLGRFGSCAACVTAFSGEACILRAVTSAIAPTVPPPRAAPDPPARAAICPRWRLRASSASRGISWAAAQAGDHVRDTTGGKEGKEVGDAPSAHQVDLLVG